MTNAERQRAYRQRNAGRNVTGPVTPTVTRNAPVTVCANCSVLAEEVAHLKRLLATAHARTAPVMVADNPAPWTECIHGALVGSCRKLGCQPK